MKKIINILNKGKGVLTLAPEDLQVIEKPVKLPEFPETIVGRKLIILDQDDNIIMESSADAIPQTRTYTGVDGQADGIDYANGIPINITVPALPAGAVVTGTECFITYTTNGDSYKSELRTRITPPNSAVVTDIQTSTSDTNGTLTDAPLATFASSENPVGNWLFEFLDTFNDTGIDQTISEVKIVVSFTAPVALFVNGSVVADNIFPPTPPTPHLRNYIYDFLVPVSSFAANTNAYVMRNNVSSSIFNPIFEVSSYNWATEIVTSTNVTAHPVISNQKAKKIILSYNNVSTSIIVRILYFEITGVNTNSLNNAIIFEKTLTATTNIKQSVIEIPNEIELKAGGFLTFALFNNNTACTVGTLHIKLLTDDL